MAFPRRAWVMTGLLCAIGAGIGALAAITLTYLGNALLASINGSGVITYRWNVAALAVMGAIASPALAWSALRRVPLWRIVVEPAAAGVVAGTLVMVTTPLAVVLLVPAAMLGAVARLHFTYRAPATGKLLPR